MSSGPARIDISLIAHTNAGKTTIARTLLREDIGEVSDRPHVTELAESRVLIESPEGDTLVLWDTPGFGDSARLLKRLQRAHNPLGWFFTQVWDRFTDRPFWCSQQAMRNARDESDVVLYVANAAEDPASVGYVDAELEILAWVGKPIVILLNQLGPPQDREAASADVARWQSYAGTRKLVCGVLPFDAFARCWVQEGTLLEQLNRCLPADLQPALERLHAAWRLRNLEVFRKSVEVLANQLAAAAVDEEPIAPRRVQDKARAWLREVATGVAHQDQSVERAQATLAKRLDVQVREATAELVRLHGLTGKATGEVLQKMGSEFSVQRPPDADKAGVIGGLVSGALGGLAADLAAGGLTFGAGALIGGVLGAIGARELTRAYNYSRGTETGTVRWSADFLTQRAVAALVRYLAVAHFGRGRGEFVESAAPGHWRSVVSEVVEARRAAFEAVWQLAQQGAGREAVAAALVPAATECAKDALTRLYPESASVFNARTLMEVS